MLTPVGSRTTTDETPTIDLQEIYIAALKRNCTIRIVDRIGYVLFVEITEDNGVTYTVRLYDS